MVSRCVDFRVVKCLYLNADHRSICRFSSSAGQHYRLVEGAIKDIITGEVPSQQPSTSTQSTSPTGSSDLIPPRDQGARRSLDRTSPLPSTAGRAFQPGYSIKPISRSPAPSTSESQPSRRLSRAPASSSEGQETTSLDSPRATNASEMPDDPVTVKVHGIRVYSESSPKAVFGTLTSTPRSASVSFLERALIEEHRDPGRFRTFSCSLSPEFVNADVTSMTDWVQIWINRPVSNSKHLVTKFATHGMTYLLCRRKLPRAGRAIIWIRVCAYTNTRRSPHSSASLSKSGTGRPLTRRQVGESKSI